MPPIQLPYLISKRIDNNLCILCSNTKSTTYYIRNGFRFTRCACGLLSQNPRPLFDDMVKEYQRYHSESEDDITYYKMSMSKIHKSAVKLIARHFSNPGNILDIGCGYGFFLRAMKRLGWSVMGIDLAENVVRYAREILGVKIIEDRFESAYLEDKRFDVITAFYVIEHTYNPLSFLEKAFHLLKPSGMLLLRFPNTSPIVRTEKVLGERLNLYHTPYHMYDFSNATIKRALEKVGFKDISILMGGYTIPKSMLVRYTAHVFFGLLQRFESLYIIPGVSRNVIAFKRL